MKRIAIVTCKNRINKVEDDLIIKEYLNEHGYESLIVSWDDKKVKWDNYDIIFIRSVWNSSVNYRKYCSFLSMLEKNNIDVINGVDNIIDNMCKKQHNNNQYSVFMNDSYKNIKNKVESIINNISFNSIVLKPMVGESSYHVFRFNKNKEKTKNSKCLNFIIRKIYKDNKKYGNPGILIEKFNEDIFKGEYCIYYFNNRITYCIKKYPSVFQDRKDVEIVKNIPDKIIDYINSYNLISNGYGRIDLLFNKTVYLMEIEKNDPDLYLRKLDKDMQDKVLEEILKMISGENYE